MKFLIAALCLVALVALVNAGGDWCKSKEMVTKMCGPEGEAMKAKMAEKMTAECKEKLTTYKPKGDKICTNFKSDDDWEKACKDTKALLGEMKSANPDCMKRPQ